MRYIAKLDAHRAGRHDQQVEELAQVIADFLNRSSEDEGFPVTDHGVQEFERDLARHIIREMAKKAIA